MFVHEIPSSVEYCQRIIVPVSPLRVSVPLFVPAHSLAAPEITPPMETGFTVIAAAAVLAAGQVPLVMFALYEVVAVRSL